MNLHRRTFVQSALAASLSVAPASRGAFAANSDDTHAAIDAAAKRPVLKKEPFPDPVVLESVELLHHKGNFLSRVRSKDGAVGYSVSHNQKMADLYPIAVNRVLPFFAGKDARELDALVDQVYLHQSNYKLQGLALWIPLATVEFAILDMLGKIAGMSIGQLLGGIHHKQIAIYQANNYRGLSAEESVQRIERAVKQSSAQAVKFKIGGRMQQPDRPSGRTEKLIPLLRETFGPKMTIYADANGAYDVPEAIRIGRLLQEQNIDFYEEPVPFDWYEETKQVADALEIPIAGGEQEPSLRNFRWLIGYRVLTICQPDLFYFGGMIRSMRVARMAAAAGLECTPHISGTGLGYLYMLHFVSATPNAGPYHEFKGLSRGIPIQCDTSSLKSEAGRITVPTGPGDGLDIAPEFLKKHQVVKA